MSPRRLAFFLGLGALSLIWSVVALMASGTRFEYRNMIESIRTGDEPPRQQALADAIDAYTSAMHLAPCNAALHEDMTLLLGQDTDVAMAGDAADEDESLKRTQDELAAHLSCSPNDGKAWLDFATIDIYREGFTKKALGAYRMSALVAPGESWLAEKRLLFALQFRPLLDEGAVKIARNDLVVLKRAHPNRMVGVVTAANLADEPALYAAFGAVPPKAQ
jgi:hypothetical protein